MSIQYLLNKFSVTLKVQNNSVSVLCTNSSQSKNYFIRLKKCIILGKWHT